MERTRNLRLMDYENVGNVMRSEAQTARGSIPGWNSVFTELLFLLKGQ